MISPTVSRPQEEQHRSHENCLDAASDDLLDLQRNLPERRGRGRELEDYRLRKEYLEYEVRRRGSPSARASPAPSADPLPPSGGRFHPCSRRPPRCSGRGWHLCALSVHTRAQSVCRVHSGPFSSCPGGTEQLLVWKYSRTLFF